MDGTGGALELGAEDHGCPECNGGFLGTLARFAARWHLASIGTKILKHSIMQDKNTLLLHQHV